MPRPHRPNPLGTRPPKSDVEAFKAWKAAHPKQETAKERRERKRHEAEERSQ